MCVLTCAVILLNLHVAPNGNKLALIREMFFFVFHHLYVSGNAYVTWFAIFFKLV